MSDHPLIAVRVKDGIFVGNIVAAHDEDFLFMNKVTHIVNCAAIELRDLYERSGIHYLSFPWKDCTGSVCSTVMFDNGDRNIEQIVRFIDRALEAGECALIASYYGVSRSCAVATAFCIVKYGWTLDSALSFMSLAHQDMNIKPYFVRQLRTFAKRHEVAFDVFNVEVDDRPFALDNDQLMLRNTYLNGLGADIQQRSDLYATVAAEVRLNEPNYKNAGKRRRRIVFCDTKQGTTISSSITQPVVSARAAGRHVDPFTGTRTEAIAERQSILARRGTPIDRRLESPPDVNPKGRQVLLCRAPLATNAPEMGAATDYMPATYYEMQIPASVDQRHALHPAPYDQRVGRTIALQPPAAAPSSRPGRGPIRNPFMLSSAVGPVRTGSPLPKPRGSSDRGALLPMQQQQQSFHQQQPPRTVEHLRGSGGQQYDIPTSSTRIGRASSPIKRPPAPVVAPRNSSPQPFIRTSSPMSRVTVSTHQVIPNAHATITTLRGGGTVVRPFSAVPVGVIGQPFRTASPQRRAVSPQVRDSGGREFTRAGSPLPRQQGNSLAAHYLGHDSGENPGATSGAQPTTSRFSSVRETNASILRRNARFQLTAGRR